MADTSSEGFGTLPNLSERTDHHTLTVREVARMFEDAGVPRTERSIINWCQPNRQGVSRLNAFFDANEHRYFITSESAALAIEEEKSKVAARGQNTSQETPKVREEPRAPEVGGETKRPNVPNSSEDESDDKDLQWKIRDLEVNNRVKDRYIEQLEKNIDSFNQERQGYIDRLIGFSQQIRTLKNKLFQLGAPVTPNEFPTDNPTSDQVQLDP